LIVYAPTDVDFAEYKDLARFCNDKVMEYRRYRMEAPPGKRYLELQK
jgi:hypothetical protein